MDSFEYQRVEERIQAALASIEPDVKPNISALAREYDVDAQRLRRRFRGAGDRSSIGGNNKRLSDAQELALCQTIEREEDDGTYLRQWQVEDRANWILKLQHDEEGAAGDPPRVSSVWGARFLARHPEFTVRKSKPIANKRKWAHNPVELSGWFHRFRIATQKYGISPQDIYNFDETGFSVGMGGAQRVVTRWSNQTVFHESSSKKEHITSVETIAGDGFALPPFVILSAKTHIHKFYFEGGFDDETAVGMSESGYMNEELAMPYLEHFNKYTIKRRLGRWRMLLFDGLKSHRTDHFVNYCWENHIVPIELPPHATHLMQPLDVVAFQPFKHHHRKAIDRALRLGIYEFNRIEFIAAFQRMRADTFTSSTVKTSWREAGLIPFDPDKVLDRIRQKQPSPPPEIPFTPSTPEESTRHPKQLSPWATPTHSCAFDVYEFWIRKHISFEPHDVLERFGRYLKGVKAKIISGEEAMDTLRELKRAAALHVKRQEGTREIVQKGGVLYAGDARAQMEARRRENEVGKVRRQLWANKRPRNRRVAFKRGMKWLEDIDASLVEDDALQGPAKRSRRGSI